MLAQRAAVSALDRPEGLERPGVVSELQVEELALGMRAGQRGLQAEASLAEAWEPARQGWELLASLRTPLAAQPGAGQAASLAAGRAGQRACSAGRSRGHSRTK